MNRKYRTLFIGMALLALFALWTVLVQAIDVQPAGETGKAVGFATVNIRFHQRTGVHLLLYHATDWLGLVPLIICLCFGLLGLHQLIQRKSLRRVDADLLLLGIYYALVILAYLAFEMCPVNYRPILIEGRPEASYPSSTTLLVLAVMPTLVFQADRRMQKSAVRQTVRTLSILFSLAMVAGRLISGVHWLTDIIGSVLLSQGLFLSYRASVLFCSGEKI